MIQTSFTAQKQLANTLNVPSVPYGEIFTRQSNEVTNNAIRSVGINNQLTISAALNAARENIKIYNRTVDTLTDFYTNMAKAWTTFYTQQAATVRTTGSNSSQGSKKPAFFSFFFGILNK